MGRKPVEARVYGGLSSAQRVTRRRTQLLEAGLDLLGREGVTATTVTAVCERAGLSPRYFYESFEDLDQLLVAVFDTVVTEVVTEVEQHLPQAGAGMTDVLRANITAWVDVAGRDPRKGRVAFVEALGSEALMRRRLTSTRNFADSLTAHAKSLYGASAAHVDALEMAGLVAAGALIETMIEWLEGRLERRPQELTDDYTTLCSAVFGTAIGDTLRTTY